MIAKQLTTLVLLLGSVYGSSSTTCNPMSASCSADPALATAYSEDFTTNSTHFKTYKYGEQVHYTDEGLRLTLAERFDNPSIVSEEYILFGRVEALVKAANGTGIISTVYLQSDVLDEIDWEWFGGDGEQVATDFFNKGNTSTYDRGTYYDMADPRSDFHNYTLDWTESEITWYVDGKVARTLKNTTSQGYPQTPCKLYIGLWAGGDSSNAEGTIEWAGGSTDYSEAPFNMYVKKLIVTDYSSGSEYSYTDKSGDLDSIEASDGEVFGNYKEGIQEFDELLDGETLSGSAGSSTGYHDGSTLAGSQFSSLAAEVASTTQNSDDGSSTVLSSGYSTESSDSSKSSSSTKKSSASSVDSAGGAINYYPSTSWTVGSVSFVLMIVGLL